MKVLLQIRVNLTEEPPFFFRILLKSDFKLCLFIQEETDNLKKKVAILECQLRKSEATKRSFEMSTGKLLSFVEVNI